MAKFETIIKSEMVRLARREIRKISVPLGQELKLLKNEISNLHKTILPLERFVVHQQRELAKRAPLLEASPEEVKGSRFSPRLIRTLRRHLGITQRELALLTGVTIGAVHQWESGQFKPKMDKKAMMVALRKLGRREVRRLLMEKKKEIIKKNPRASKKPTRKGGRK